MISNVTVDGKILRLELELTDEGWKCRLDGRTIDLDAVLVRRGVLSILIQGKAYEVTREGNGGDLRLWVGDACYAVELRDPRSLRGRRDGAGDARGPIKLAAPMPGKVVRVLVRESVSVQAGQGIMVVEAMKMQNEIKSPKAGTVRTLSAQEGDNVNAGDVLAIVE